MEYLHKFDGIIHEYFVYRVVYINYRTQPLPILGPGYVLDTSKTGQISSFNTIQKRMYREIKDYGPGRTDQPWKIQQQVFLVSHSKKDACCK